MISATCRTLSYCCRVITVVALLCLSVWSAKAQVANGVFTGSVTDQTGAVVPSAKVAVTNEGTNVTVTQKVNSAGLYTVSDLHPGFYTLKAEAQGFRAVVNTHIELTVGYTQRVDFKLEVGAVTQEITISSQAPLVDTV